MGDSAYPGTQVVAAVCAIGLAILAGLVTKLRISSGGRGGLLMGRDPRASTSKTITVVWSALIAYMLLTLIFVAHSYLSTALRDTINNAPDLHFNFLGGPYAAAVLAKVGVSYNTQSGTLQKSDGSGVFNPPSYNRKLWMHDLVKGRDVPSKLSNQRVRRVRPARRDTPMLKLVLRQALSALLGHQ